MKRTLLLAGACALDACLGDPAQLPHPVRAMGWAIERGEAFLRARSGESAKAQVGAGTLLWCAIVGGSALVGVGAARRDWPLQIYAAASVLALHDLLREARAVLAALESGDLLQARANLSRIVGRDTAALDPSEIARATVETLAESASDGVIAPMIALAIGGLPLAFAYKAINTLDSMVGHLNARYRWFGRCAARADDVANYLPARVTAVALAVAASMLERSGVRSMQLWLRDGGLHASPNAGQCEAAMSGALGVRLGGTNSYAGLATPGATLGREFRTARAGDIRRAMRLVTVATALVAISALGFARWIDG